MSNQPEAHEQDPKKDTYNASVYCGNCGNKYDLEIKIGQLVKDSKCTVCACACLKLRN